MNVIARKCIKTIRIIITEKKSKMLSNSTADSEKQLESTADNTMPEAFHI